MTNHVGQQINRLFQQPVLFGLVVEHAEVFVNPAVNAYLVALARENGRNDLGIQRGAHRRDEK